MAQFKTANIPVVQMPAATFDDLKTTVRITGDVPWRSSSQYCRRLYQLFEYQHSKVTAVTSTIPGGAKALMYSTPANI